MIYFQFAAFLVQSSGHPSLTGMTCLYMGIGPELWTSQAAHYLAQPQIPAISEVLLFICALLVLTQTNCLIHSSP